MMTKSLRRALDRLRAKTNNALHKKTAVREGLQEPLRMQGILRRVRGHS
jgi:hypothetical protein